MLDFSIILPTCNRACAAREGTGSRSRAACAVRTRSSSWTVRATITRPTCSPHASPRMGDRLRVIREERREGFVRAANKGFRVGAGKYMTWLNDDARPVNGALDLAVQQLESAESDVAFVAMFHRWNSLKNVAYETDHRGRTYRLCHVRGTLYANFPVGMRETYEKLDLLRRARFRLRRRSGSVAEGVARGIEDHPRVRRVHRSRRGARRSPEQRFDNLPSKTIRSSSTNGTCRRRTRGEMISILHARARCAACGTSMRWPLESDLSDDHDFRTPTCWSASSSSTHNRRKALLNTLASTVLLRAAAGSVRNLVVDNASTDGTADAVGTRFSAGARAPQKKNRGCVRRTSRCRRRAGDTSCFSTTIRIPLYGSMRG